MHIATFDTPLNVGCGFDAIMLGTTFDHVETEQVGGSVDVSVFDEFNEDQAVDWDSKD